MTLTNFPNGITSFGIPVVGSAPLNSGTYYFVDTGTGADGNSGTSLTRALATIQRAVNIAPNDSVILVAPGTYDETVTISRPTGESKNLVFVGMGPRGSVAIAPTTTDAGAVINHADDITFVNIGMAANGTGTAFINSGSRMRAYGCKLENGDGTGLCAEVIVGTVAQDAAGTRGTAGDCMFDDCEFAWAASGLQLTCSDYGAVTELLVQRCRFHNMDTKHILELVGSGGSAAVTFAALQIQDCTFLRNESAVEPTNYIDLNGDNANNGIVTRNSFPTALAGGKNLVSTALLWVCNYHTGGVSGAQPS